MNWVAMSLKFVTPLVLCGTLALPSWALDPLPPTLNSALPTLPVQVKERIKEVRFAGNSVTQAKVMLRELPYVRGQAGDVALLERGRQAIQDLGLFNAVHVAVQQDPDGWIVTYTVEEKRYLLPLPRFELNSDGQYAYGAQLRWNNVFGLNHTLRVVAQRRQPQQAGVGEESAGFVSYFAPFVADSPWGIGASSSYVTRQRASAAGRYTESFTSAAVSTSRFFSAEGPNGLSAASQGYFAGGGLQWVQQQTSGVVAPYGSALAPVLFAGFRDLRFNVYSEQGLAYGLRLEGAQRGVAADYSYVQTGLGVAQYIPIGHSPHQTLNLFANTGARWAGPANTAAYGVGGASQLRGYVNDYRSGDAYYYGAAELARPVIWPWLRAVAIAEVGDAVAQPSRLTHSKPLLSLGLGLRLRFVGFVNFEVEAGVALPLNGGGGPRVFAGGI